ncbi:MAG: hypothetical protein BZY88_20495 [SAR202 cluster bacterium Io17-Chloro-G9]|nr:MAG: hypothetical protein BZY88_20495 [SAR202 cluster bacterium Io17-Chloro-G9]
MLFHVTLGHDAAHCPGYHPELMPVWIEGFEKREELARGLGVKIHSILNAAPDHVVYVIGEADRPMQMAMFVSQFLPTEQAEIKMNAVEDVADTLAFIREMGPPGS